MSQYTIADSASITATWQKASASGKNGDCVELAPYQDRIAIRDSKSPHGPAILYPRSAVTALLASL